MRVTLALGSRVLGEPRTEAASKAVTDSNLCLGAPAQRPADMDGNLVPSTVARDAPEWTICASATRAWHTF